MYVLFHAVVLLYMWPLQLQNIMSSEKAKHLHVLNEFNVLYITLCALAFCSDSLSCNADVVCDKSNLQQVTHIFAFLYSDMHDECTH